MGYFLPFLPLPLASFLAGNLNINLALAATEDEDVIHLPQYSADDYFIYWVALRHGWETRESIIEHIPELIQEYCQAYATFISGSSEFDNLIRKIVVFFSDAYNSIRPQHIWIGYLALLAVATIYSMVSAKSEDKVEIDKSKLDRSFPRWDELEEMVDRINAGENPTDKDVIWEIGKVAIGSEWCYSALKDAYRVDSTAVADLIPKCQSHPSAYYVLNLSQHFDTKLYIKAK